MWFYINDVPSFVPDSPVVNRYTDIILKAKVVNETNYPLPNQNVQFFDFWSGMQIGTNTTDANGIATYSYYLAKAVKKTKDEHQRRHNIKTISCRN